MSESGELTETGRSYIPPSVLLDALCTVCSSASQWGDAAEAESLAMEILIVSHHPSIGKGAPERCNRCLRERSTDAAAVFMCF